MSSKHAALIFLLFAAVTQGVLVPRLSRAQDSMDPPGRVGLVSASEGRVSLDPAGTDTWVADVANRPLGTGDRLWSDENSRAEVKVGSTTLRLAARTGIEFLALNDSQLQLRLSAGTVQLHVRRLDAGQSLELDTPGGAVTILRPGVYRLDVADSVNDLRVEVMRGQAEIATDTRSTLLEAGQLGEFGAGADAQTTSLLPPDDFDRWAAARDQRDDRSVSARYVSADVPGYAALDDYGDWAAYPTYGAVWLPRVSVGFVPYRDGRWQWIAPWGWTWIDSAPWGFVPFHYGRWVNLGGRWGWCPGPAGHAGYFAPALVGWIGGRGWSENYFGRSTVGWFPLGWNEAYVPGYRASAHYARELNLANTQLTRTYLNNNLGSENYRSGTGSAGARYANQQVPGAVTIVSRESFTRAAPIGAAARGLAGLDLSRAPVQPFTPVPAAEARNGSVGQLVGGPASSALWNRPVLARLTPAPPALAGTNTLRHVTVRPMAAPATAQVRMAIPSTGGVSRAYADRPPYAAPPARMAGATGHAPERARADRPWSARPETALPTPAPATQRGPAAAGSHLPTPLERRPIQERAPAHGGGPQRMSLRPPAPSLPQRHQAAYHQASPSHRKSPSR